MVNLDNKTPATKTPATSQSMWDMAYNDYVYADIMLQATRDNPDATPDDIFRRECDVRVRKAICNALNFLITNEADVEAAINTRQRRRAS